MGLTALLNGEELDEIKPGDDLGKQILVSTCQSLVQILERELKYEESDEIILQFVFSDEKLKVSVSAEDAQKREVLRILSKELS